MDCTCCFEKILEQVKYRDKENGEWKDCFYCKDCIQHMLNTQFLNYVEKIKNETCKKTLETLIQLGPPTKFRDPNINCDNEKNEVYEFNLFPSTLENVYPEKELEEYKFFLNSLLNKEFDEKDQFLNEDD